jgi:hypothetical protein
MRITKQTLFKIELSNPKVQWTDIFFVEADNFEEALAIAKEVMVDHYEGWDIKSINLHAPLFKSLTKTITIEV